ncbi:hypothetical protein BuS5_01680 [Desulfosarcina sp. BuS5]|nr:hypothetical protein BuS5_01680 [Desulfosarcina sp. BuS5]
MGRAWRIEYEGGLYHVLSRGNERKDIFHPEKVLEKAAGILNCGLDEIRRSRRISKSIKDDRYLLVYLVWKECMLPNEETGRLFGITYSAVSHILKSMRGRMQKEHDLRAKYKRIYSLCKM